MKLLWTWSGKFFGYREDNVLLTQDGYHVGQFHDDEIYAPNGTYLGEIKSDSRLIRSRGKSSYRKYPFQPLPKRPAIVGYVPYCGYVMYAGYEEFPAL